MTDSGRNTITHAEQTADTPKNKIRNTTPKDSGAKLIFDNHPLCAQFLRGYTDVELLKNVQPDDIEDISERFVWMWHEERESADPSDRLLRWSGELYCYNKFQREGSAQRYPGGIYS